jgi:hypothetical protein
MRDKGLAAIGIAVLVVALLVAGGVIWLANAHIAPPAQTIEQPIPDDRIPH